MTATISTVARAMPARAPHTACAFAAAALSLLAAPAAAAPPPPPEIVFSYDAVFGSNMVLQRAPAKAAIYGYLQPGATGAVVTVTTAGGAPVATVTASVNATVQPFGAGFGVRPCPKEVCPPYDMEPFTPFAFPLPTWKALLPPMPAGGDFVVTTTCVGCPTPAAPLVIVNVTFGDVWFCSGQSNMWLQVQHTFSRNDTANNITAGKYQNVRVMAGSSGAVPYAHWPPTYGAAGGSNPWMTALQAAPPGCVEAQNCPLFAVGGTCWYTAQALAEAGVDVPIGILDTAIGGQRIEEYLVNTTVAACTQLLGANIPWWNGQLWGQQTLPFVDMSLAGWLWYQGEVRKRRGGWEVGWRFITPHPHQRSR